MDKFPISQNETVPGKIEPSLALLKFLEVNHEELGPSKERLTRVEDIIPGINTENLISLDQFPEQVPDVKGRYDERVFEGSDMANAFSREIWRYLLDLRREDSEEFSKMQERFRDSTIVDIGAGAEIFGIVIANVLNAKGYIGVEPFNFRDLSKTTLVNSYETQIPFNLVMEDALAFLRRLPDNSVALLSGGIADEVIGNDEYLKELEIEMGRVLKENGICMVSNSARPRSPVGSNDYLNKKLTLKQVGANTPITFLEK